MKINKLEIENVKRVKAVKIEPTANGLTIIGGDNGQGKTSVLDAIAWALGGNKYKPSNAKREGSTIPPTLHIVMDNGLVVERKGKNSSLTVIDPNGNKAGQQLLDSFINELALNLPKFMEASNKEKAQILLQILGVGEQLIAIEKDEQDTYNQRHAIGQIADQKKKFAQEQTYYPEAPKELVSASDLIKQQQEILARNGENERKRQKLAEITQKKMAVARDMQDLQTKIRELQEKLEASKSEHAQLIKDEEISMKTIAELKDESTAELEASIQQIDEINRKVRANLDKDKAEEDAHEYADQYAELTEMLQQIRQSKTDLLKNANLPLEGLSIEDGELTYKGFKWDGMSGSERMIVATSIVRKLNPKCGFVLMDKLEQMDLKTLKAFGEWLEAEGLQAIATRVSTGEECSIVIEDGYVKGQTALPANQPAVDTPVQSTWTF